MAQVRLVFSEPQRIDSAMVTELTVEADRLVFAQDGTVVLDVAADTVALVERAGESRLARLRAEHPNHGKPWTVREDDDLRRMFGDGVGTAELARHFGRSRGAVRSALLRLGLVERPGA